MKPWTITSFEGVNNVGDASSLKQPDPDQYDKSGSGTCELVKCVNFDIDDNGGLIQRDDDQAIFSAAYDDKWPQTFAGRVWTVDGDKLYYSLPWKLEADPRRASIQYNAPIILIQEVEEGMWISTTEKIYFHAGRNPTVLGGFRQTAEYDFPAIAGTGEKVSGSKLGSDSVDGFVAIFATTKGLCYGNKSGALTNMSEGVYSYEVGERGISAIKEENGIIQYMVKMINAGDSYNPNERKEEIVINDI
jgi:hypothetical protein